VRYWCEQAWLGGPEPEPGVLLEVEGDRITAVTPGAPPEGERLPGLTLPGLANAHSHAFQRALRGRTHAGTGTFWTWREQMYELAATLDAERYRPLARAAFAEMLLAGITVVGEFHYVHGEGMEEAVLAAAAEAGIRITLLDTCYLHGGLERFRDASAEAWAERTATLMQKGSDPFCTRDGATARIGAAAHSVRAVGPEALRVVADVARERSWPLHAHVSEQPAENDEARERHGATPTELLDRAGALDDRFTAVHATHLTPSDVALLGHARVCLCPTTERDLADGIGPARALRDAGASLALGSDSQAVIDLFEEARAVELDERLASGERGRHAPEDLLSAATAGGYDSLGWPEGGRLRAGALADFTTIALDSVRLAGTDNAVPAAVFAAAAPDVRHVVVGGRVVVRDGAHVELDVPRELAEAIPR
jgi:formiminoglutamate deiminase